MYSPRSIVFLLLLGMLAFQATGCKDDQTPTDPNTNPTVDSAASKQKSDQAYALVETEMNKMINGNYSTPSQFDQFNFQSALTTYNEAITLNPANTDARFGAAFTQILAAYADPAINKLIKDMDSSSMKKSSVITKLISTTFLPSGTGKMALPVAPAAAGVAFGISKAMTDPPLISRMQTVLRDNFLPKIQAAIDHLDKIESNESFKFIISGKMQGDPSLKNVVLYPTEAALMNGMLNWLKFNIQCMLVYKFELADYTQASLMAALNRNNTTFFVLQSDGKQRAVDAKNTMAAAIGKMKKAIDFLKRISGNKSDAIIKIGTGSGSVKQTDLDTLTTYLNKIESTLSSDFSVELKNADTDGNSYTIKVNLGNFLSNPPANPKRDLLPAYTVSASGSQDVDMKFDAATYAEFNFPDPTMGGLFPGMQQETLKRIMEIDKDYAFRFDGYVNIRPFYWGVNLSGMTVKLTTAAGTYSTNTDSWGNFRMFVRDAGSTAQPVTKFSIVRNGEEYEFVNINIYSFAGVKAKVHEWANFNLILKPVNLSAVSQLSPYGVNLSWNVNMSYPYVDYWQSAYRIQRKTSTSSYEDYIRNFPYMSGFNTLDDGVSSGIVYSYRIRSITNVDELGLQNNYLYMMPKNSLYSNEVSITPDAPITGTWLSEGTNLAPGAKSAFKLKKVVMTIYANSTYSFVQTDSGNVVTTFTGTFVTTPSEWYDYSPFSNTYGQMLYELSVYQQTPATVISKGICASSNSTFTYECMQVSPAIAGLQPATTSGGFGSTLYNNVRQNNLWVYKFIKQ